MPIVFQPWDEFFTGFETGDIVLMHGMFVSSIFIEAITKSNWSHCGVVMISDDIGLTTVPSGTVLFWESNILAKKGTDPNQGVTDVILDTEKQGPMMDRLAERITNNTELKDDSDVAKRKLTFPRTDEMMVTLKAGIEQMHPLSFPEIPIGEMGNFILGRLANAPVTDGTCFCSQLAAHTYKAWGLLTEEHVDNWYAPANFGDGAWGAEAPLLEGATLGPEIRLDPSTIPPYPGY